MLYSYTTELYRKTGVKLANGEEEKLSVKVKVDFDSTTQIFTATNATTGETIDVPSTMKKDYNGTRTELPFIDALLIGQFNIWLSGQVFDLESTVEGWTKEELRAEVEKLPQTTESEQKWKFGLLFLVDEKGGATKVYKKLGLAKK